MRYLVLIYGDENSSPRPNTLELHEMSTGYRKFTDDVIQRGLMQAGEALQPISTATTVRVRNGERLVTDGPFAETKEQLGGFYLLKCKDLDEAIDCAAAIPGARFGSIEIRPIWELS
jgi:hypothetical protein